MKLHHIGVVVGDIEKAIDEIKEIIDFDEITNPIHIQTQKVNVSFLKIEKMKIEFIESINNESPVSRFSENGGGIHHLCFEVKNIHEEIKKFKKKGCRIIVEPTLGFENRLIAFVFLNLKNSKVNLIELAEEK